MESERYERDPESQDEHQEWPEELILLLQRTINYPRDTEGARLLAQALVEASQKAHVAMRAIVDRCRETSQYCPTDFDLLNVARDLRVEFLRDKNEKAQRHQREEWRRQYGPPQAFSADTVRGGNCQCCGRAWGEISATSRKRESELWEKVWAHIGVPKNTRHLTGWGKIYKAMTDLGYPLTREQRVMMERAL